MFRNIHLELHIYFILKSNIFLQYITVYLLKIVIIFLFITELVSISQLTTEFHFPPIDEQLEKIRDDVKDAVAWRQAHHKEDTDLQVSY